MSSDSPEPLKVQIVGHVNSNYPDAWRTRKDYIDDQRKAFWLFVMQIVTLIVAVFAMVGTYLQVAVALKSASPQHANALASQKPTSMQESTTPTPMPASSGGSKAISLPASGGSASQSSRPYSTSSRSWSPPDTSPAITQDSNTPRTSRPEVMPNRPIDADQQQQEAASPQGLRSGCLQRYTVL